MATLTPTKLTGGAVKSRPGVYAEPDRQLTPEQLEQPFISTGLNGVFVADLLSACLTHERCGRHLYRSCEGRTNSAALEAKYKEFGKETERHVQILEQLIASAGGNPSYMSPHARAVEGMNSNLLQSTFLLGGSVDLITEEIAMLDAVFVAESIDHANWKALAQLGAQLPQGALRESFQQATDEVEQQEDEHLEWASQTRARLTMLLARSEKVAEVESQTESMAARVKNWLRD
jgi:rubrerythrin